MFPGKTCALLSLPVATIAVTLSDFRSSRDTLQAADLSPSCLKVYKADVGGCLPEDFTGGAGCGQACVRALQSMVGKVQDACSDEGLAGTGIITAFLRPNGVSSVCPGAANVPDVDSASSTSAASTTSSNTIPQSTSKVSSSLEISSATSSIETTARLSGTVTASSFLPTATEAGLLVDTSSAATPSSTNSQVISQSGNGDHGGQGSPFDTQDNTAGGAMAMASFSFTTMFLTAATILTAALR